MTLAYTWLRKPPTQTTCCMTPYMWTQRQKDLPPDGPYELTLRALALLPLRRLQNSCGRIYQHAALDLQDAIYRGVHGCN